MPAEPIERDRYAHVRDEDYRYLVTQAAHLCEVALRPTAIDTYAAEKLRQVAGFIEQASEIIERNIGPREDDSAAR